MQTRPSSSTLVFWLLGLCTIAFGIIAIVERYQMSTMDLVIERLTDRMNQAEQRELERALLPSTPSATAPGTVLETGLPAPLLVSSQPTQPLLTTAQSYQISPDRLWIAEATSTGNEWYQDGVLNIVHHQIILHSTTGQPDRVSLEVNETVNAENTGVHRWTLIGWSTDQSGVYYVATPVTEAEGAGKWISGYEALGEFGAEVIFASIITGKAQSVWSLKPPTGDHGSTASFTGIRDINLRDKVVLYTMREYRNVSGSAAVSKEILYLDRLPHGEAKQIFETTVSKDNDEGIMSARMSPDAKQVAVVTYTANGEYEQAPDYVYALQSVDPATGKTTMLGSSPKEKGWSWVAKGWQDNRTILVEQTKFVGDTMTKKDLTFTLK